MLEHPVVPGKTTIEQRRQMDDQTLAGLVRRGDEAARATLADRHGYAARRLARQLAGPDQAERISRAAFARVFASLCAPELDGHPRPFRWQVFSEIRQEAAMSTDSTTHRPAGDHDR